MTVRMGGCRRRHRRRRSRGLAILAHCFANHDEVRQNVIVKSKMSFDAPFALRVNPSEKDAIGTQNGIRPMLA